jgi:hypothetical protein
VVGYGESMTTLLEEAMKRVSSLPQEEQNAIASQIFETIEDEDTWRRKLASSPQRLRALAEEALAENQRGETRPIEELP